MNVRPRVQYGHSRSQEIIYVAGHDAEVMQDRRRRDKQVRLREGGTHGLSLFYEATPDHKDIPVHIEQPVRKPGPQLVCEPRLEPLSGWIDCGQSLDAIPDLGDRDPA